MSGRPASGRGGGVMRCKQCGWVVRKGKCPCGATIGRKDGLIPVGTRTLARLSRGPSPIHWLSGEVAQHSGRLHQVKTRMGEFWCEADDLLPEAAEREQALENG